MGIVKGGVLVMRIGIHLYAALLGLVSLSPAVFAQSQTRTSDQDDRIVVGTNLVTLNVNSDRQQRTLRERPRARAI